MANPVASTSVVIKGAETTAGDFNADNSIATRSETLKECNLCQPLESVQS